MKERDMQGQGVKNRSMKGQSMKDLEMKRRFGWLSRKMAVRSLICVAGGILFYFAAELSGASQEGVESGILKRNRQGGGDLGYEFLVDGLEEQEVLASVLVPEQKLSKEQLKASLPKIMETLCREIKGENPSLLEVRSDLEFPAELPEYGLSLSWESQEPELISHLGVLSEERPDTAKEVLIRVTLTNGLAAEEAEIPVTVLPLESTVSSRFLEFLSSLAQQEEEKADVRLPETFEGRRLSYRSLDSSGNEILLFMGPLAAAVLVLKDKNDEKLRRKKWEDGLLADYPDLVSGFLVLTGAGYPVRQAWKKQVQDYKRAPKKGYHPVYEEMEITLNQMETGMPEVRAYGEFGKRTGLRCYVRLVSLLESGVSMGGREMRRHLETEMENAFSQRKDLAMRKGEEAATKLLLPMFFMLGVVMVMVAAPAFLTLG